jgi:hypothetical protein
LAEQEKAAGSLPKKAKQIELRRYAAAAEQAPAEPQKKLRAEIEGTACGIARPPTQKSEQQTLDRSARLARYTDRTFAASGLQHQRRWNGTTW